MPEPSGKTVVITGASRGLGEAMAVGFAAAGADVALVARSEAELERVAARCRQAGPGRFGVFPADVTVEAEVDEAFAGAAAALGPLDTVIANAAVAPASLGAPEMTSLGSYRGDVVLRILQVNVLGVWASMKAAFLRMRRGGGFIAVSSEIAVRPRPGNGLLAASKAAVNTLVTIAATEQADAGIRVNLLSPGGVVDTQLFGPGGVPGWLRRRVPVAEPEVIVPAALWLASDDAAGVTGAFLSAAHFNESTPDAVRAELAAPAPAPGTAR